MASDLISREALLEELGESLQAVKGGTKWMMGTQQGLENAVVMVKEAPAVDAVEVVRCKECKYFKFGDYCYHDGAMEHSHARENDFCSYGIRRKKKDAVD